MGANKEELLAFLKSENVISIPMLQNRFSLSYQDALKTVNDLVQDNTLKYDSGLMYRFMLDEESSEEPCDEDSEEKAEDEEAEREVYIEARRRALMERLMKMREQDDDEEDNGDGEEDELTQENESEDENEEDENVVPALKEVLENLHGWDIRTSEDRFFITLNEFALKENLELILSGNKPYLTDCGAMIRTFRGSPAYNRAGANEALKKAIEHYGVIVVDDELRIEIVDPEKSLMCVFRLSGAMVCLKALSEI